MENQRGVALSGLLFWSIVLVLVAVLGMKVAPTYIETPLTAFGMRETELSSAAPTAGQPEPTQPPHSARTSRACGSRGMICGSPFLVSGIVHSFRTKLI